MKKLLSLFMTFSIALALFAGCSTRAEPTPQEAPKDSGAPETSGASTFHIVATIFPIYDWLREIVGESENVELTLLLHNGVDLHSYQPSVDDIIKISTCDVFIYTGGESDLWVYDVLKSATNEDMLVINLLDALGDRAVIEEIIEGMEHDHGHEHHHDHDHEHDHSHDHEHDYSHDYNYAHEAVLDEHIWLSLKNAKLLCAYLELALSELDSGNAGFYAANAAGYIARLDALDEEYAQVVSAAGCDTLLFADRFPFRYLVDDYGLSYFAAFSGCSAETEASFETVIFLARKLDELGLSHIMIIDTSDGALARTVSQSSSGKNQNILALNSMQAVSAVEISAGISYLSIMEDNLTVLKAALN